MQTADASTVFILHGGKTSIDSSQNDEFFLQSTELVEKNSVHIALCYWSRVKEQWDALAAQNQDKITKQTSKQVKFSVVQSVEDLYIKLEQADVLYVAGGEEELIEPYLQKLSQLKEKLKGKVYLGSSMGAFIVSSHYVLSLSTQNENKVYKGLGILPINTLCHWNVENKKQHKINLLRKADSKLPIVLLDEQRFVKFVY